MDGFGPDKRRGERLRLQLHPVLVVMGFLAIVVIVQLLPIFGE